MKKLQLLGFICLFFILFSPVVAGQVCFNRAEIYLELEAVIRGTKILSDRQFPKFKEGDVLYIKSIELLNTGSCNWTESELQIKLFYPSGELWSDYPSKIKINRNITSGENYTLTKTPSSYIFTDDFGFYHGVQTYLLDETGTWQLKIDIIPNTSKGYYSFPPNIRVQGEERYGYFDVYSVAFLESEETANTALKYTQGLFILTIILLIATIWTNRTLINEQRKQGRKMESMFKSISRRIKKLHDLIHDEIRKRD